MKGGRKGAMEGELTMTMRKRREENTR